MNKINKGNLYNKKGSESRLRESIYSFLSLLDTNKMAEMSKFANQSKDKTASKVMGNDRVRCGANGKGGGKE